MRKLGEQWVELIDGKEHVLKVVEQAKTVNADVCGGCYFGVCGDICHDGALHVCGYGEGKCPLDNVDWVIKDLGILNDDGCLPCPFCGEYPVVENAYEGCGYTPPDGCWRVYCSNDNHEISMSSGKRRQESIDAWNRRT